jgi:putative phage-type endonuclease
MKIYEEIIQGSVEWLKIRCGKVTASHAKDVMAGGQGKTRKSYMMKLLAEIDSGVPQETYKNGAMEWGTETEPEARLFYEERNLINVKQVGFVELNGNIGCSPDGLVGDDGLIEIKCPNTATHLGYILSGKMPTEYVKQVQFQLWVTERKHCDFVSYDPRSKSRPFWSIRVERDDTMITKIKTETEIFVSELKELYTKLAS